MVTSRASASMEDSGAIGIREWKKGKEGEGKEDTYILLGSSKFNNPFLDSSPTKKMISSHPNNSEGGGNIRNKTIDSNLFSLSYTMSTIHRLSIV